jgi:hypothetical protein
MKQVLATVALVAMTLPAAGPARADGQSTIQWLFPNWFGEVVYFDNGDSCEIDKTGNSAQILAGYETMAGNLTIWARDRANIFYYFGNQWGVGGHIECVQLGFSYDQ